MRLFLAQQASLYDYEGIKNGFAPCLEGRWRISESLHATLLFLGERPDPKPIITQLSDTVFELDSRELTSFGLFERRRIFYAAGEHPMLLHCRKQAAAALGIKPDDDPVVHVTLMRYKVIDRECCAHARETFPVESLPVGKMHGPVTLYRSILTPKGAVYEPIHTF